MKISIIGCGNMGRALAERLSKHHSLFLYDHKQDKAIALELAGYGQACQQLKDALKEIDFIILAVKPQSLHSIAALIAECEPFTGTIVSLLAGTDLAKLQDYFPTHQLIRMMPNLAMVYGHGLIGLAAEDLPEAQKEQICDLCALLGKVYWLPEAKIDAFTSLASSGPAFVFAMIEAMVDAGIAMGFNATDSQELVLQMMQGCLHLLTISNKHPAEFKWLIASPAGTTIAGIRKLEESALRSSIIDTFLAAYDRATHLHAGK